jgi:hypothetical protein
VIASGNVGKHPDTVYMGRSSGYPEPVAPAWQPKANSTQVIAFEQPWQLVRKRRWWRKERRIQCKAQPPRVSLRHSNKFKEKVQGRCFNCLACDHALAHCRDLPRCWCCNKSSHISSSYPLAHISPLPSLSASSASSNRNHVIHQEPKPMECR